MPEEGKDIIPSRALSQKKDPQVRVDARTAELWGATIEENKTNPGTDPDEALDRIRRIAKWIIEEEDPIVTRAYEEILERSGRNPGEWVRYFSVEPKDIHLGFTDQDMHSLTNRYPQGLEFFVIQGQPLGYIERHGESQGQQIYDMANYRWIGFVRKRPTSSLLEEGMP